ncbi:MAG: outer membrane protein assembly factor BamA [Verrucomicrobia bacterium]|nr:outer membrane protein assembly factor BamA [Verrucomicrobiota bacterium]
MLKRAAVVLVVVFACLFGSSAWAAADGASERQSGTPFDGLTVRDIEFQGLQRTRTQLVLYKMKTRVGTPYSAETVSDDEQRLMQSGYFSSVTVSVQPLTDGVRVILSFREKPTIKAIIFEGNERYKTARLLKKLTVQRGEIFDEVELVKGIAEIYELYEKKGYYDISVVHRPEYDREANEVTVLITVREGRRAIVRDIQFVGAEHAKRATLLRLIKTKRRNALSWLTGRGKLKRDVLEDDLLRLSGHFRSLGFLDVEIEPPVQEFIETKKDAVRLTFTIKEGPQYRTGQTSFSGFHSFPEEALRAQLALAPGDVLDANKLEQERLAVSDFYEQRGYVDVRVAGRLSPGTGEQVLDVHFAIEEGQRIRIGRIEVTGNYVTKDKVIRREVSLVPGDYYDGVKLRKSRSRLMNLRYFMRVDMLLEPTEHDDVRDLIIVVEEAHTGRLMGGLGFSSIDKLMATFEIGQSNFDLKNWPSLRGGGQKAQLKATFGTKRRDMVLSFTEPWFFDRKLLFGFEAFARDYLTPKDYDQSTLGFSTRLSKPLWPSVRGTVRYTLQRVEIDAEEDASELIRREEGKKTIGSLQGELDRDTRDSYFLPTRGSRITLSEEVAATWLGGDEEFHKEMLAASWYVSVFEGHVVRLRAEIAGVEEFGDSEDVSIFERLFLGGPRTIRGFDYQDVGPKDEFGEPIGGKSSLLLSVEYTFPIVSPIRGAVFYDTGNVWPEAYDYDVSDLRAGTGIGLRIMIPAFGAEFPFNIDYAWPIDRDEFVDSKPRFDFTFGFTF